MRTEAIEKDRRGHRLDDRTGHTFVTDQVQQHEPEDPVRVHERAVLVHGTDTVGVTVGSEAAIESFVGNQVLKSADVRWDRLRVQPAESGVRLRVKLVDLDAELSQYTGQRRWPHRLRAP